MSPDQERERGPRSISLRWRESSPGRVPGIGQLGTGTQAAAVLGRHAAGEVEWFLDQREQEGEVEPLRIGSVVNAHCLRFCDDGAEE